jgi:acetoacetyl-CoA reductase
LAWDSDAALRLAQVKHPATTIEATGAQAPAHNNNERFDWERVMTSRVALVTGGTGGIGTAICERLARMGHRVATNYRDEAKAKAWQAALKAKGTAITIVPGDVSTGESAAALVKGVVDALGPVDILINNAGITRDSTFHRMSAMQWQEVINTNLNSCYFVTRAVIDGMRERKWGRIVQIASINGQKGQYGQANYAASKAGMHGFTISLAQESAKLGITVNTVSPGYVATEMVMAVPEEVRAKIAAQIPVGRLGTPEEVAYAVAFFMPDEAAWVTGANLSINGGHYMGW